MAKFEGGCLCGKVRYSAEAEPIFTGVCHCKSCQKLTGTSFSIVVAIPSPALSVTGDVKVYDTKGDSGQATHSTFCPNCGSPVIDTADMMQGVTMIRAGTMDDSGLVIRRLLVETDHGNLLRQQNALGRVGRRSQKLPENADA